MLFFHNISVVEASTSRILPRKALHSSQLYPNHWYVVRQNSFLTSGVFAVDATALFFATVRWRGIATLLGVALSGPLLRL